MKNTEKILGRCTPQGDCMIWQGATHRQGYGMIRVDAKMQTVHRVVGLDKYGNPGDSGTYKFSQTCGNKLCCNPDHIVVKTHSDVMNDCVPWRKPKTGKRSTLQPEDVVAIRNDPDSGWGSFVRLAKKYGTTENTVGKIRRGETYQWIQ